jgi:histidine ammonia-lyase
VLLESLDRLDAVLAIELNAAAENPLVGADDVFHNGNFHQAPLAAALDASRLALLSSAQLGAARLGALTEPRLTGLGAFLAVGPPGSSGVMIVEYTVASALAALRAAAAPVVGGNAVLSRGAEEHASFAPQGVRQLIAAIAAYRVVLAGELMVAMRALRLSGRQPASPSLRRAYDRADALPSDTADRSLADDLELAAALLEPLARGSDQ